MVAVQPRDRPTSARGNETRPRPGKQPRARARVWSRAPPRARRRRAAVEPRRSCDGARV